MAARKPKTTRRRPQPEEAREGRQLSPKQARAIERILEGGQPQEIRAEIGVAKSTWHLWHDPRKHPLFVAELERLRAERQGAVVEYGRSRLQRMFEVLIEVAEDPESGGMARVRAAESVIGLIGYKPPEPPAPADRDPVAQEVAENIRQVRTMLEAQGLALLDAQGALPTTTNPWQAVAERDLRIAELMAEVARLRA